MPDPTFQVAKNDEVILIASRGAILTLPHAEALQMAEQVVALLRLPAPPAPRKPGYPRTDEEKAEFRRLYEQERWPGRMIAKHFGFAPSSFSNARKRFGIPARNPKSGVAGRAAYAAKKLRAV